MDHSLLDRDEELPVMMIEVTMLIEYLKVKSIAGDADPRIYLTSKQSRPLVLESYEDLVK